MSTPEVFRAQSQLRAHSPSSGRTLPRNLNQGQRKFLEALARVRHKPQSASIKARAASRESSLPRRKPSPDARELGPTSRNLSGVTRDIDATTIQLTTVRETTRTARNTTPTSNESTTASGNSAVGLRNTSKATRISSIGTLDRGTEEARATVVPTLSSATTVRLSTASLDPNIASRNTRLRSRRSGTRLTDEDKPPTSTFPESFGVQAILMHREVDGQYSYLVHWEGYSEGASTWEPPRHVVPTSLRLIVEYHEDIDFWFGNVDVILDRKPSYQATQEQDPPEAEYLVKWEGWEGVQWRTWQPLVYEDYKDLIYAWWEKQYLISQEF